MRRPRPTFSSRNASRASGRWAISLRNQSANSDFRPSRGCLATTAAAVSRPRPPSRAPGHVERRPGLHQPGLDTLAVTYLDVQVQHERLRERVGSRTWPTVRARELSRGLAAVDREALRAVASPEPFRQPEIVQHRRDVEQLVVVAHAVAEREQPRPEIRAERVVRDRLARSLRAQLGSRLRGRRLGRPDPLEIRLQLLRRPDPAPQRAWHALEQQASDLRLQLQPVPRAEPAVRPLGPAQRADHQRRAFTARSISRSASRFAMSRRLSCACLPLPTASSTFTLPFLK